MKRTYEDHLKDQQQEQQQSSTTSTSSSHCTDHPPGSLGTINSTNVNSSIPTANPTQCYNPPINQQQPSTTLHNVVNPMIPMNHNRIINPPTTNNAPGINLTNVAQSINSSNKPPTSCNEQPLNKKPKINPSTTIPSSLLTTGSSSGSSGITNPQLPMNTSNMPNLSSLPPLSMNNFLFATPPFLQAAAAAQRNRSNSGTSNNGNIPITYPNPALTPNLFIPTPGNLVQSQRLRSNSSSNNIITPIPTPTTLQNTLQNSLQNRLRSNSSSNLPPFFLQQPPTNLGQPLSNPSTPQKKPTNIHSNTSSPSISNQVHSSSTTTTNTSNTNTNNTTNSTVNMSTNDPTNLRSQKLRETWYEIYKSLKKLESFVNGKTSQNFHMKPWENNEHVSLFTTIYNLCILPDSVYYEEQLYNLYSIYIKKYLNSTILPKLKDKYGEDLLNEIVFIWINFRDIFVKFCSYIFKYLDQFYVASNSRRTLKYEAYFLFKTIIFEQTKTQLRQIVLDKVCQDRKNYNSDNSYYISQRQLLKQTLQLFAEMDDSNINSQSNVEYSNSGSSNSGNNSSLMSSGTNNMMVDYSSSSTSEVYVDEFEKFAEKETSEYYHKIANEWIEKYNLTEYLLFAEECIHQEQTRIQAIFPSNFSQIKLMKICDVELLKNMEKRLLEMSGSGVKILIRDEKFDDLKRLYRLMNRLEGGLDPIADLFKQYLIFVGNELFIKYENASSEMIKSSNDNNNNSNTISTCASSSSSSSGIQHVISNEVYSKVVRFLIDSYVQDLLELHQKMKNITNGSFSRNVIFHKAMSEGFKQFVNKNISLGQFEIRIVQLFAYYTDDLLRKKSDEKKLDSIVDFIQFFSDRDMFIEEHRKLFAIRLLVTDYQELEERMMISKLKYHYRGVADTYKLEKMLTDKTMANDMKTEFQSYVGVNQLPLAYDVNVTVLTMGMWPLKAKESMLLPKEFSDSQQVFKQFYDSRNGKRVLKWVYSKSMAQIHAQYTNGNHLFEVTTLQASILLLFNENQVLSIKQIEDMTGLNYDGTAQSNNGSNGGSGSIKTSSFGSGSIDLNNNSDIDLKQAITSLSSPKFPILNYDLKEMTLKLNENYSNRSFKLKIPLPRITQKDTQGTQTSVNTDRIHILDACVVRIMKTRKTMNIQSLFNEVASQLIPIFTPDVKQIKKRIESLIERDFLKRDESNNSIIHYVA